MPSCLVTSRTPRSRLRRVRGAGLGVAMLLLPAQARGADGNAAQVTLPLDQYEVLHNAHEGPSLTVVDTLRVSGSFRARDLQVEFAGRAAGRTPTTRVLSTAEDVVVYGCQGDGLVSRAEQGGFQLTPLAPRFTVRCRLQARGSDRLELSTTAAVLWVESAVVDGEFVATGAQDGQHTFALVRQATGAPTGVMEPTSTGRYRLTLLPDETRFRYQIDVNNPNRGQHAFALTLASGERVQQVDSTVPYESAGARTTFMLPPGEHTLTLSGRLSGAAFAPPVVASLQYVLIESHPLLRPQIKGGARRIAPDEVGLTAAFRGAQAFLLGRGDGLTWSVTRLQALRSTSYALKDAQHAFYLGADGATLGESRFVLDNQGASELRLPRSAEPTFASLQGETVLLTKDDDGQLLLPIAQGAQELLVQHRQAFVSRLGFAQAQVWVPELPVPATRTHVELRYPQDWLPLYESFGARSRIWSPALGDVVVFLLACLWSARVLALLGVGTRQRQALAGLAGLAVYAWDPAALLVFGACLLVTLAWGLALARTRAWSLARRLGVALVALVVGVLLLVVFVSSLRLGGMREAASGRGDYESASPASSAPQRGQFPPGAYAKSEQDGGKRLDAPMDAEPQYEGLPARIDLPVGAQRSYFERELLTPGAARRVRAVLVSAQVLEMLRALVVLALAALLWLTRSTLTTGWRQLAHRLRDAPTSAGSVPSDGLA